MFLGLCNGLVNGRACVWALMFGPGTHSRRTYPLAFSVFQSVMSQSELELSVPLLPNVMDSMGSSFTSSATLNAYKSFSRVSEPGDEVGKSSSSTDPFAPLLRGDARLSIGYSTAESVQFRKGFHIMLKIGVKVPRDYEELAETSSTLGQQNSVYWHIFPFQAGFLLPLHTLLHQLFYYTRKHPTDTHVNVIRVLLGMSVIIMQHQVSLGLDELFMVYNFKRLKVGKFFFTKKHSPLQLMLSLLSTHKHGSKDHALHPFCSSFSSGSSAIFVVIIIFYLLISSFFVYERRIDGG